MKKVLIIGHFWPYRGGSKRMIGLAKYLPLFGWEPIIITGSLTKRPSSEFRVVEIPCREVFDFWKKFFKLLGIGSQKGTSRDIKERLGITSHKSFIDFLINFYLAVFSYPDSFKGWRRLAVEKAKEIIKKENVSAVISVWPVSSHLIAKKLGIFWIADFPDLWSENCDYTFGPIRKFFDRNLEIKTLKNVNALVVLSKYDKETQQKIHKNKQVYAIPHGYDIEELSESPPKLTEKLTFTYAGTFYNKKRDPSKLFGALKELIDEKVIKLEDIEIRIYGPKEDWVLEIAKKNNLLPILKQEGTVERKVVLEKERESQVLLLFKWEDSKEKGVYSGKIFEYLATKRPILAIGGSKDAVTDLIEDTNSGTDAINFSEIKKALKEIYSEYKEKGFISYKGDIKKVEKYSSKEMAASFAKILNGKT